MKRVSLIVLFVSLSMAGQLSAEQSHHVNMANGIKVGEVDSSSAIVWTRLTVNPERNIDGIPFTKRENPGKTRDRKPYHYDLEKMEGVVPGIDGQVRFIYWPADDKKKQIITAWHTVWASEDFTYQMKLEGLSPATKYFIIAVGRSGRGEVTCSVGGGFITAALADAPSHVSFTVVTGQDYPRRDDKMNGHKIYPIMQSLKPNFFVHTGDIEYYDKAGPYADNLELARFKWNRIYSMPFQRMFHNNVASYFIKDDHDTLKNDSWAGQTYGDLTWEQGLATFREQVPMGDKTYRTIRWGKDLQVWLVEGRDFRSPNNMPDGPDKTIWGKQQKKWFFDTVSKSDATFRVLISPTPVVGPDRETKKDNHANKCFKHEGDEIRSFIGKQKNMFVVCGDRHWQYSSVHPETGVREYSCGPTADVHAGGFKEEYRTSMHRYLKVKGGFLSVVVDRRQGVPEIKFRHYGVDGTIYNEEVHKSK